MAANYPPVSEFGAAYLNFSEDDSAAFGERPKRSVDFAISLVTSDPATSYLYQRITDSSEVLPFGMMPVDALLPPPIRVHPPLVCRRRPCTPLATPTSPR